MNIENLLKVKSLKGAKVISGSKGITKEIKGVNVLEALDIENWGRCGDVILTSFFALQNLSDEEYDIFFEKLSTIGISALIIKIERLVQNIPKKIIELCDAHSIPLIQINSSMKYESIILDILSPIIDNNVSLLNKYYEVHSELTKLALKMPSMDEILKEFKNMIMNDVSFINHENHTEFSTNSKLSKGIPMGELEVPKEKYMQFNYKKFQVKYTGTSPETHGKEIRVTIPFQGFDYYELIIHETSREIKEEDYMVIENAVKFLQMELLKKYLVTQNSIQYKNNLISDLLNDKLYEKKAIEETLDSLNINKHKYYQVILIWLYEKNQNSPLDNASIQHILVQIRNKFCNNHKDIAFLEKSNRIVFIANFENIEKSFTVKTIENLISSFKKDPLFKKLYFITTISSVVEKSNIPKANKEVLDAQRLTRLLPKENKVLLYEELGLYKLLLQANTPNDLESFVSPQISRFKSEHPQLFETLETFLDTNQNYTLTSKTLFLHPKTVRYRIEKTKELLNTDFTNPEEILQYQIAARLFKLIEGGN